MSAELYLVLCCHSDEGKWKVILHFEIELKVGIKREMATLVSDGVDEAYHMALTIELHLKLPYVR